jgi:hypothetical protein
MRRWTKKERIEIFLKLVKTPKHDFLLLKKRLDDASKDSDEIEVGNLSVGNDSQIKEDKNGIVVIDKIDDMDISEDEDEDKENDG